jgi:hypothetical protein
MAQTAAAAAKVGTDLYVQANDAMSKQQAVLHSRELDELMREYQQLQGHDAYMGRGEFQKNVEKLRQKYAKSLQNDDQITLFNRMVDAQMAQATGRADQHSARETRAWNIQMTQVNLNKFAQDYADAAAEDEDEIDVRRQIYKNSGLSPEDAQAEVDAELGASDSRMDRMGVARAAMEAEFMKLQRLAGMDEKTAREAMKMSAQQLHGSTMKMLTDQDPKKARAYFDANKDEMSAAQVASINEKLDKLDAEDQALATVREAMASAGPGATPTERYQKVLDAAANEKDADVYRLMISFANSEFAQQTRLDNGIKNDLMEQAEVFIYAPENAGKTYEDLPPSMREDLEENGLVDEVMDIIGGRQRRTSEAAMIQLLENPGVLKDMSAESFVRTYKPRLSAKDFRAAQQEYNAQNGIQAPGTPMPSVFSFPQEIQMILDHYGLTADVVKADPEKAALATRIREQINALNEAGRLTKEMGHDARMAELHSIFKFEAKLPRSFLWIDSLYPDEAKPYELMTEDERAQAYVQFTTFDGKTKELKVAAIPDRPEGRVGDIGVRTKLFRDLQARGADTSTRSMLRLWDAFGQPQKVSEMLEFAEANPDLVEDLFRKAALEKADAVRRYRERLESNPYRPPLPGIPSGFLKGQSKTEAK